MARVYNRYEDRECAILADYLRDNKLYFMRIACEIPTKRMGVIRRMQREGFQAGYADYFLYEPTDNFPGLFIEMKHQDGNFPVKTGKDPQHSMLLSYARKGYITYVCKGAESAIKAIEYYFEGIYKTIYIEGKNKKPREMGRCYNILI